MDYAVTKSGRALLTVVKLDSVDVLSSGTILFCQHFGLSLLILNKLSRVLVFQ